MLNEGYKQEDFLDKPEVSAETYTEQEKAPELNNAETSQETCNEEKQVEELAVSEDAVQTVETKPKSKRGRKQKK